MRFGGPSSKFFLFGLLLVVYSCTIIKDSDITSSEELSTLKWKGFEVTQQTSTGTLLAANAKLLYDSVQNIVVDPTTKIIRLQRFALDPSGNSKLKLKSGTTGKTEFTITYKTGNQPYTMGVYKGDSIVEIYRFRYDATNRLNKIVTIINPVDGLPAKVRNNDTLIYDTSSKLSSIIRRSPDAAAAGTFAITYQTASGTASSPTVPSSISFKGGTPYQISSSQNQGNCSDLNTCGRIGYQSCAGGCIQVDYLFYAVNTLLDQVILWDSRKVDTYYIHPLIFIKNQFTVGSSLFMIYSYDWWSPGGSSNTSSNGNNDIVTFKMIYGS